MFVSLQLSADHLTLTVQDDGIGFSPAAARPGGNGLNNMARRLADVGGRCDLDSTPQRGTRVVLVVPVAARHANL